ncbi:RnfH family protein [Piscinibacter sp. XHJ-5]|uniref:RnfH family protein n=1 Tax=Piscinibacter sp. XHJ-5 TaxID=3037797 RepID=UPI002452B2D5|nr:RnfH family protein [Piscinibacter sp. XHJ-5]
MGPDEAAGAITVVVAYSPDARQVDHCRVTLAQGATVHDALRASGVLERHPDIDVQAQKVGVWGKLRALDAVLRDGDRVEVYRPLKVDPKEARRQRYRSHREKLKPAR